ncbi:MAG: hypothetical protein ACOH18_03195 [Candidatus Saccharimonadaceae bacterium]
MSSTCDKCGTPVDITNDVTVLEAILTRNNFFLLAFARHLLPVVEGDRVICEGSPSRAQYLEGQPRDTRSDYPYYPGQEKVMREAYAELQQVVEAIVDDDVVETHTE